MPPPRKSPQTGTIALDDILTLDGILELIRKIVANLPQEGEHSTITISHSKPGVLDVVFGAPHRG